MLRSAAIALTLVAQLAAATPTDPSPFDPPIGGWPANAAKGSFDNLLLDSLVKNDGTGIEDAKICLGVPDGGNGGPTYTPTRAWPLVICLHGSAFNGTEAVTISSFFRPVCKAYGAIFVAPQCWYRNNVLEWTYPNEMAYIMQVIREVGHDYRIDSQQVIVIGHSMGGGGAWSMGDVMRDLWSGIGPASGAWAFSPGPRAARLSTMPYYILHGDQDVQVPIANSDMADNALKGFGYKLFYDRVAGGTHGSVLSVNGRISSNVAAMISTLLYTDAQRTQPRRRPTRVNLSQVQADIAAWGAPFGWAPGGTPLGRFTDIPATNHAPQITVQPTATPASATVGQAVAFAATATDPDAASGDAPFYRWDFGEHGTSVAWGRTPTWTYRDPGTYTVTLTVSDFYGVTTTATKTVTVSAAAAGANPVISAPTGATGTVGLAFSVNVVASGAPNLYHAAGLPPGLGIDPGSGAITGTPTLAGTYAVALSAYQGAGSGHATISMVISQTGQTNTAPQVSRSATAATIVLP